MDELIRTVHNMASPSGKSGMEVTSLAQAREQKAVLREREKLALQKGMEIGYERFAEQLLNQCAAVQQMAFDRVMASTRVLDANGDPVLDADGNIVHDASLANDKDLNRALALAEKVVDRVKGRATQRIETKSANLFLHKLAESGELDGW